MRKFKSKLVLKIVKGTTSSGPHESVTAREKTASSVVEIRITLEIRDVLKSDTEDIVEVIQLSMEKKKIYRFIIP